MLIDRHNIFKKDILSIITETYPISRELVKRKLLDKYNSTYNLAAYCFAENELLDEKRIHIDINNNYRPIHKYEFVGTTNDIDRIWRD